MLARAPGVGYLHEPFNPTTDAGISGRVFTRFLQYVTAENEQQYATTLERALHFSYDLRRQLPAVRSPRALARTLVDLTRFGAWRATRARALVKDPIAVFSAPWLAERFGMDVVVTVRQPAAFVASLKRLGWRHDFSSLAEQHRLLADHLAPYESDIRRYARAPGDVVDESILLWRMIYHTVDSYRSAHPEWQFVRHEDLSRDPLEGFARLYGVLDLELTTRARAAITAHSATTNPEHLTRAHAVRLDSRASLDGWRRILTPDEVRRVRTGVSDVAPAFYPETEW